MKGQSNSILGVVEGFYGVFYTFPQRTDLIRFLGQHGFNWYLYAPKNDRQHRARWWEAYPEKIMAQFSETVSVAQEASVTFCYSISPAGIGYSNPEDFERLTHKLQAFYQIGVRAFALLYDDNDPSFHYAPDRSRYSSPSQAQADLANRLYAWLKTLDRRCMLHVCPVDYWGQAPFSRALHALGQELDPSIDLFYTGPQICSPEITANDVRQFTDTVYRSPILWDNYPVNDLSMQGELHVGPLSGRTPELLRAVRGVLANPMYLPEASKIPLLTLADFWRSPLRYNPARAFDNAILTVAGEESAPALRVVFENCYISCLGSSGQTLAGLSAAALQSLKDGESSSASSALCALESYLTAIDEATYHIKFRMENLALRNDLLPWIEVLEHWMWMTRFALQALRAIENNRSFLSELKRVHEYREQIQNHPKIVTAQSLLPLVEYILHRVEEDQRRRVSCEWAASLSAQ